MEQHLQDYRVYTQETDQANMSSVKVLPDNVEQANTPGVIAQPQTAVPTQQSHPPLLLSELSEEDFRDNPGHTQGVDQVTITSAEVKLGVADQADISHPTAATEKQSNPSPRKHSVRVS